MSLWLYFLSPVQLRTVAEWLWWPPAVWPRSIHPHSKEYLIYFPLGYLCPAGLCLLPVIFLRQVLVGFSPTLKCFISSFTTLGIQTSARLGCCSIEYAGWSSYAAQFLCKQTTSRAILDCSSQIYLHCRSTLVSVIKK